MPRKRFLQDILIKKAYSNDDKQKKYARKEILARYYG